VELRVCVSAFGNSAIQDAISHELPRSTQCWRAADLAPCSRARSEHLVLAALPEPPVTPQPRSSRRCRSDLGDLGTEVVRRGSRWPNRGPPCPPAGSAHVLKLQKSSSFLCLKLSRCPRWIGDSIIQALLIRSCSVIPQTKEFGGGLRWIQSSTNHLGI